MCTAVGGALIHAHPYAHAWVRPQNKECCIHTRAPTVPILEGQSLLLKQKFAIVPPENRDKGCLFAIDPPENRDKGCLFAIDPPENRDKGCLFAIVPPEIGTKVAYLL
jgi:hypothetical protein